MADVLLAFSLAVGAACTVVGGLRVLVDPNDGRGENAFGIGLALLLPLTILFGLRYLSAGPRNR